MNLFCPRLLRTRFPLPSSSAHPSPPHTLIRQLGAIQRHACPRWEQYELCIRAHARWRGYSSRCHSKNNTSARNNCRRDTRNISITSSSSSVSEGVDALHSTVALWVQYAGAGFSGWEAKPGARTVQGELQNAATSLYGVPISVVGASRTDAGVHACGQIAHLRVPK